LLSNGKQLPQTSVTQSSIIIKIDADVFAEKLVELSISYKQLTKIDIDLEKLLVLNSIYTGQKLTFNQLENTSFVNRYQLRKILLELQELELIETTGKTSDVKYLIHKSKLESVHDEKQYLKHKKQNRFKQKQIILKYLSEFEEIDNKTARNVLILPDNEIYNISRMFKELRESNEIRISRNEKGITYYVKN
jgi:hypothetical protein